VNLCSRRDVDILPRSSAVIKARLYVDTERLPGSLYTQERDELVSEVVRYILFKNFAKNGRPISQSELSEIVNKRYSGSKKGLSGPVVKLAQSKLLEIFGMELRSITRAVACTKGRSKKGSGATVVL
jgi:hypothetical protein